MTIEQFAALKTELDVALNHDTATATSRLKAAAPP